MKLARAIGSLVGSATLSYRAIAADQKRIWSFPWTAARGDAWKPAFGVIGATAALIALDPLTAAPLQRPAFQEIPLIRKLNYILSGRNMAVVINGVYLAFFLTGIILRKPWMWQTGLLAAEAAGDAEILAITMKHIDRRTRPLDVLPDGDFRCTWFCTKRRDLGGAGCFPSGHTASSFAVATIFAARYPRYRWLAYGSAGTIGASRMLTRAHYPSDVFFGAAVGYSISRCVVLQRDVGAFVRGLVETTQSPEKNQNQQYRSETNTGAASGSPAAIAVIAAPATE